MLERMKLSLPRIAEGRPTLEGVDRHALDELDVDKPRTVRGLELLLEELAVVVAAEKKVPVDSFEIAIDVLERSDRFNAVDCSRMTLGRDTGSLFAVQLLDLFVVIVECSRDVSGCTSGFAPSNRAIVYHYDSSARAGEEICGRHSGDARPHYANVSADVVGQRRKLRDIGSHPDRRGVAGVASHCLLIACSE